MKATKIKRIITQYDVKISLKENNKLYNFGGGAFYFKSDFKDLEELDKDKDYFIEISCSTCPDYGRFSNKAIYQPDLGYVFKFIDYNDAIEFIEEVNKINKSDDDDYQPFEKIDLEKERKSLQNVVCAFVEKWYFRENDTEKNEEAIKDYQDYILHLQKNIFFLEKIMDEKYSY